LGLPTPHANAIFIEYQDYLIFNHATDMLTQFGQPDVSFSLDDQPVLNNIHLDLTWQESDFSKAISKAQVAIREGDIYQLNLSYPATVKTHYSLHALYHHIHKANDPLHGALIQTNDWGIASASPEELFYLKNGHIRTRPIKGTIGRHHDPVKDQYARNVLKNSIKDHAELVMITDLMRNDLSQFSETGSVITTKLCDLIEFPYVYHLVSTVEARVSEDISPLDILKQLAPGGSITGCPKRSACQIISQIEPKPREFYTGHIGFISSSGEASFNVAIRTCYQYHQGPIITHAGCGITIDSIPTNEYQESMDKFRFLTQCETVTA
jgi:anthranilate/para-aminobenzoate synthase component I